MRAPVASIDRFDLDLALVAPLQAAANSESWSRDAIEINRAPALDDQRFRR